MNLLWVNSLTSNVDKKICIWNWNSKGFSGNSSALSATTIIQDSPVSTVVPATRISATVGSYKF
jgi:myo-inositol-1-phosphate synthase